MREIVVDVESFYSSEYSLRKMTPVEYILDHRWETIGWAVKDNGAETMWMVDEQFRSYLSGLPKDVMMISHNALFDMSVLAWRYGYVPALMVDTLGMARAWMGHKMRSLALATLAKYLEIGVKGDTVHKVQGLSLAAIKAAGFYDDYAEYSKGDADLCYTIFKLIMKEGFPISEIGVMDTVLRCAVQPSFVLDQGLLAEHLHLVQADKQALMDRIGVNHHDAFAPGMTVKDVLMSNEHFATALRSLGVDPPMKTSLVTGKQAYAFAKTDAEFIDLEEHENPEVQALVSARLGVKSTIEETRTQRLLSIAQLTWPGNEQGLMPIPLRYSGAHTHRLSGDWRLNMQNLPSRGNNKIRSSLKAPKGHVVVAVDASQIEARVAAWFCGADKITTAFSNREDVYSTFASTVFGYEVHKSTHKVERFIGKTCLASGSIVVTDKGLIPIEQVSAGDRLWDGEEWVCHSGVVSNGLKKTLQICGLWLTPDHRVLCGKTWREAQYLADRPNTLSRALETAAENLPSQVTSWARAAGLNPSSSSVTAGGPSLPSTAITSRISKARAALLAATPLAGKSVTGNMLMRYLMTGTAPACSTAWLRPSHAVIAPAAGFTSTMGAGGFTSIRGGATTAPRFSVTSKDSPAGITPLLKWIAQITARVTCQVTSGSSAPQTTPETSGRSPNSKPVSVNSRRDCQVYDLANAGPRNRFTVMTDAGPLIVHNCILGLQYGLGWLKFQGTVAMQSKAQVGQEVILDDTEAVRVVQTYRREFSEIPAMWRRLDGLIPQMTSRTCNVTVGPVTFLHEKIRLPSGLYLHYHNLQHTDGQWMFTYGGKPKYLYGGKMLENIVQALSRICVMDAALRVRRRIREEGHDGIRLNLQVHDELVYICPEHQAEWLKGVVHEEMCRRPAWGPDIPLDAEGDYGPSYGDCK